MTVRISSPAKVMFPQAGITKEDLAVHYERMADLMLPHVRGRPVHMQRFPDGIEGEEIQQKQAPAYFPGFVRRVEVPRKRGGSIEQVVIEDVDTLVYLAGQACITPHVWLARADRLDRPDRMVIDLDPPDTRSFPDVRRAARAARDLLDEVGLCAYLTTTGSRGLHVVSPLDRRADFDAVRAFARDLAAVLQARDADRLTTEQRRDRRGHRIYLDTARNGYAQTVVAPYAVRASARAPIACPIGWDDLGRVEPQSFTLENAPRRLLRRRDPWEAIERDARPLAPARKALDAIVAK